MSRPSPPPASSRLLRARVPRLDRSGRREALVQATRLIMNAQVDGLWHPRSSGRGSAGPTMALHAPGAAALVRADLDVRGDHGLETLVRVDSRPRTAAPK